MEAKAEILDPIDSKEPETVEISHTDGLLAFGLSMHTLSIVCTYVLVVGNLADSFSMTFLGAFLVILHFLMAEGLLKGQKKHLYKLTWPWFVVVLAEEVVLMGLSISHVQLSFMEAENSDIYLEKLGFILVFTILTGIRYFIWLKMLLKCWRNQYQQF